MLRYPVKLTRDDNGTLLVTAPDLPEVSTFGVKEVIPGMSAALQLMRVGDRWKIRMAPYLAYGPGFARKVIYLEQVDPSKDIVAVLRERGHVEAQGIDLTQGHGGSVASRARGNGTIPR